MKQAKHIANILQLLEEKLFRNTFRKDRLRGLKTRRLRCPLA